MTITRRNQKRIERAEAMTPTLPAGVGGRVFLYNPNKYSPDDPELLALLPTDGGKVILIPDNGRDENPDVIGGQ